MQYCLKLSSTARNPAYSGLLAGKFKLAFDRKPNQIPPLGIRVQPDLLILTAFASWQCNTILAHIMRALQSQLLWLNLSCRQSLGGRWCGGI